MVKALLDTNVLVSGFVSFKHPTRSPAQILHAWRVGLFELIISEDILIEVKKTLQDPYFKKHLSEEDISEAIILLSEEATLTPITAQVRGIATHPADDLILAASVSGKADYLVTGDGPLIRKVGKFYQGVKLVTPNDFLHILEQQS